MSQSRTADKTQENPPDNVLADAKLAQAAAMVILYFVYSFSLAIATEVIEIKIKQYSLKLLLEVISLVVLSYVQLRTIKYVEKFYYSRLLAINFTTWVFGKIFYFSLEYVKSGNAAHRGYALFLMSQVVYHCGEFLFVVTCHPSLISWDSFLINHSIAYGIAQVACHSEYWIEQYFFPSLKECLIPILFGLLLSCVGHFLRLGAFISARSNFTHLIQDEKRSTHELVTTGVYRISRHPSYLGWFLNTSGCQFLLMNPICLVGFTLASWKFFYERIMYEEMTLLEFFGQAYFDFMKRTPIGIPFLQQRLDKARKRRS